MPEYFHPGVYIEEIERGPRPIEGVPTSLAAFLGEAERGPVKPRLCASYKDYQRYFGDIFDPGKFLPYAVNGFFENGGGPMYVCRLVPADAAIAQVVVGNFVIKAVGAGAWGNRVYVEIGPGTTMVSDGAGGKAPAGFRMRLAYYATPPTGNPQDWFNSPATNPAPAFFEVFDDLSTKESSPDFYAKRLQDNSALATLEAQPAAAPGEAPAYGFYPLTAGTEGTLPLTDADYKGEAGQARKTPQGLASLLLDPYRDVALVYGPGADVVSVQAIIDHCRLSRFRFAAVDCDKNANASVEPRTSITDSDYAAFYYPWIAISDPKSGARRLVPPGGHMLGIYARTDAQRGVFKAPANEIVYGALDLLADTDDKTQDVLNPRGVNVIRRFPGRGIRLWGARTLSSNGLWKYVSVRRLFIFLEHSIYDGTQWVVFEPNDQRLWARVIDSVRLFLRTQWRLGALFGATEKEAFFITCDQTTMTQDDILNGRLICDIGIAPVRPAEFVVFRIFQNTADTTK